MLLEIIILAAGKGQRMHSYIPKVLQDLGGCPLLEHVIKTAKQLRPKKIHVVYGHGGEQVKARFAHEPSLSWVLQDIQLGTGHAVSQALPFCHEDSQVLILYGDVPLISSETLEKLLDKATPDNLVLLTWNTHNPFGFGRILRNEINEVVGIVEEKDATLEQKHITEIFTGILTAPRKWLEQSLSEISNDNRQGEYLLTDITYCAFEQNVPMVTLSAKNSLEIQGVNDKQQLAELERSFQWSQAVSLLKQGATLRDPARVDIRGHVNLGKDVLIDINVIFEGHVVLGDNVVIGPNCIIRDCQIADNVVIKENSVLEKSQIGTGCVIGPFARLRPGTYLNEEVHIGNFVEIKNTEMGAHSQASHLSYLGDAIIGSKVNIGAGTITCNYDGANKHQTIIGDNSFIGSGTELVAPVRIGRGGTIGAGSTITQDTPENQLILSRSQQKVITGWQRPVKRKRD